MEEGNGSPDDEEFKLAKNVSCLNDEGEENDDDAMHEFAGDGATAIWTPMESEEFHQTEDIQCIRPKNAIQYQDEDTPFISIGTKPIAQTNTKQTLRYLENMPQKGTSGCIMSTDCCKPLNGEYAEGAQFKKIQQYISRSTRRVNKCEDHSSKKPFFSKEIIKTERNKNEAIIPIQMKHQNIQVVIGVIQRDHSGSLWIELLLEDNGSSLEDFVRAQSHLQMKVLWDICDQGLHALRHIHQQSITHHDVKPGNFTINARLRVCLIDFGSVRLPYDRVSGTGWTVEYISPECAKYLLARLGKRSLPDQSQITTKVDMFSFAMTMGFVRTGEHLLIRLVAKDCKYQKGQRDRLRINLIEQISENPGAIREIISKLQIYDENLRDLLYAMSCEDVGKRISARDALAKIKELLQNIDNPTDPKTKRSVLANKVMEEQYDGDDVHSTRKLKLKGPYLEHSRIRTQESVRQGDEEAGTSESRRLQPIVIKPKQKDLPPEPARIKTTANIHQCDEFGQTEMVTSEGSTVVPPKSRKMNVPTAGGEILFSVAPNTQFIPVHAAAEGLEYVRQPEIDHEKLLQQLRTKIIQRQEQEMDQSQSPSYMDGNNSIRGTNKEDLPHFDVLLSTET